MHSDLIERNPILKHRFELALKVIAYFDRPLEQKHFIISNQLRKSGTSVGANVMEVQNAESKADVVHKMNVSAKEAEETPYWLTLCKYAGNYPPCDELLFKRNEIHKLPGKILATSQRKNPVNYLLRFFSFCFSHF